VVAVYWNIQSDRLFHVRYTELVADPLATVPRLYRHFGMTLSPLAEARIAALVAARPHGGYGLNIYPFEQFGLDAAAERRRFGAYVARFGIQSEAPRRRQAPAPVPARGRLQAR